LIALIINAHHSAWVAATNMRSLRPDTDLERPACFKIGPTTVAVKHPADMCAAHDHHLAMTIPFGRMEIARLRSSRPDGHDLHYETLGAISSLRCQTTRTRRRHL